MNQSSRWADLLLIVVIAAVVVVGLRSMRQGVEGGPQPIAAGTTLPALAVAGWLDHYGPPPLPDGEELLVVDCGASWCGPCRAEMPRLKQIRDQYKPLGVTLIGLTPETERDLPQIEKFIETVDGFDWPVGYGANSVLDALRVQAFPTVIVFNSDEEVVWSGIGSHGLADALDRLLAR